MRKGEVVKEKIVSEPKLRLHHPRGMTRCPGCQIPTVERIICEIIEELGIEKETIMVCGIGCASSREAVMIDIDAIVSCHGRPPDVATGIKRALHGKPIVFTLQGDGDCISIGAGSLIGAMARAEKITVIMVNNAVFGTTGGQWAPTTLLGQKTTTTPGGRDPSTGYPFHAAEMVAGIKGVAYSARGSLHNSANYERTKKYLKDAFQKQISNIGFSFTEILSACPIRWHLSPLQSLEWVEREMIAEFPLGEFKNVNSVD